MCGISGLAALDGRADERLEAIERMNAAMVHRGPDQGGTRRNGPVALGARRLSIIDLPGGDQPIANEDGTVFVVQNGELYNHRELREELVRRGHRFSTRSDTEVIAHLYEEHGPHFVERLRGMFSLAAWDAREQRLLVARDRFGIKPLYYRVASGLLAFASELKGLMRAPGFSHDVDLDALGALLAFNSIPAPMTIFTGTRKLPAGHLLEWSPSGEVSVRCYSRPRPAPIEGVRRESADELAAELRERLDDSVRAHLVSDVPVGVFLSGGVDSAALTALAAEHSDAPVKTFSIGFEERSFNELPGALAVAERYGTDHHELVVRPNAVELMPQLAETFDEPFADSSAVPTYLVSELAARHVKVVLSGEGADELFGGYYTYVADLLAPRLAPVASFVRPLAERLPSSSSRVSFDYKLKRFVQGAGLPPLERHHAWKEIFSAEARAELLTVADPGQTDPLGVYRDRFAETEGSELLARLQDVDVGIYLPDDLLVKTDRATMAHSLEARVPFVDPVVSDLAFSLPTEYKVRGLSKKRLLRRAVAPLLPEKTVRGRKRGFSIPAAAWLRGELAPFASDVLSPDNVRRQGYFDPAAVTSVLERHISGQQDLSRQLWCLLSFALWHERYA